MSWLPKDEEIDFEDGALILTSQAFVETIVEQCGLGLNANGESVEIDWRRSGKMLANYTIAQDGTIEWLEPYAEWVNDKQPFAGIAPRMQPELEEKLQPVLDRALVFKKKGTV